MIGQFDGLSKRIGELETAINELNKRDTTPPTELMSRLEAIERTILTRSDFENNIETLNKNLSKQLSAIKVAMIRAFPEIEGKKEDVVEEEEETPEEEETAEENPTKTRRGRSRRTS